MTWSELVFGFGKKYKCSTCGANFKTEAELTEHSKIHQTSAQAPTPMQATMSSSQFKCSTCGATFTNRMELMEHDKKAH